MGSVGRQVGPQSRARRLAFGALLACVLGLWTAARAQEAPAARRCVVETHILNTYVRLLDGQWQGNVVASDGACYFFSSSHDARQGAAFFRYDPKARDLRMLTADVTRLCGEDPAKQVPQGKVHSDIEELDGWLYTATHLARYNQREAAAYTGSHVLGYELTTGTVRDYGVLRANYSCYSGFALDPARRVAYIFLRPFSRREGPDEGAHIYRLHLDTGAAEDVGLLYKGGGSAYHLFVDRAGDCWLATQKVLFQVKAEGKEIVRWENALPEGEAWDWAQALPDRSACLFNTGGGSRLYRFDPAKAPDWKAAFTALVEIGPSHLGKAYDAQRSRVFYTQREGRKGYTRSGGAERDLHLMSVSLAPDAQPAILDHGLLFDQDGRQPWKLDSLSTDGKGRVFMVGAWHCLPDEEAKIGIDKGHLAGFCAQAFAVADVLADLPEAERRRD